MTTEHYHRIFSRIYLTALSLCTVGSIGFEYLINRSYQTDEGLFLAMRSWDSYAVNSGIWMLILPVFITGLVAGLVWLTNKIQPLTEQERQQSFIERMSKTQLFLPLSLLLVGPTAWMIRNTNRETPVWGFYLLIAVHLVATWLLVLFLKRITRIQKTGRKILAILGFIFACAAYVFAEAATLYSCSHPDYEYYDEYPEADDLEEDEENPFSDLDTALESSKESLGSRIADKILEFHDYWDGLPALLVDQAGNLLEYDSNRMYIDLVSGPVDMTPEQIQQKSEKDQAYFDNTQELSRYLKWIFDNLDYESRQSLFSCIKKGVLDQGKRFDYSQFAKRIDMLDLAYRDLNTQNSDVYEGDNRFYEIYDYAKETPLKWRNYDRFITNPYVRYVVDNEQDQLLLLWAYTFWGRRYDDDTYYTWRNILDEVLETYPNTLFPADKIEKQNKLMQAAEARVSDFLKWYKANYWSFRELKVAKYDAEGHLEKLDRDEFAKYLYALEKSGYIAPTFLKNLSDWFDKKSESVKTGSLREEQGEWLRSDPMIWDYNAIAGEIDQVTCHTDHITTPGKQMWMGTSVDRVFAGVETIDGVWMINDVMRTGN